MIDPTVKQLLRQQLVWSNHQLDRALCGPNGTLLLSVYRNHLGCLLPAGHVAFGKNYVCWIVPIECLLPAGHVAFGKDLRCGMKSGGGLLWPAGFVAFGQLRWMYVQELIELRTRSLVECQV
jgi:hypothetical protein